MLGLCVISLQTHASIAVSKPICCFTYTCEHIAVASAQACCSRYTQGTPCHVHMHICNVRLSCARLRPPSPPPPPPHTPKQRPVCIPQGVLRKTRLLKDTSQRFTILDTMSSILYPGRFTLLLGPPGAGKTTLLNALSGRLHKSPNIDVSDFFPSLLKRKEKTTLFGVKLLRSQELYWAAQSHPSCMCCIL